MMLDPNPLIRIRCGVRCGRSVALQSEAGPSVHLSAGEDGKNAAAVALGRMGGKARAAGMSAKRRKEIAKKAAKTRWGE
jgi:hypothetical protein